MSYDDIEAASMVGCLGVAVVFAALAVASVAIVIAFGSQWGLAAFAAVIAAAAGLLLMAAARHAARKEERGRGDER